eukprot:TRINITY_DN110607_c0_g1_i1.p1 TRINITY_DN110607_c0_g1~~TRINITY_DN110607_c0_g1_i1.p1  ORF type:complete len:253 (+),score=45.35 TRINITY_DN110607_c0_g1_i1:74-832(+)
MAFARDHGTMCIMLPLKLGVAFVAMAVFMDGMLCVVATFTGDIRFQPNGYNIAFYRVPTFIGVFGVLCGFIGILGVYDDKPGWVRIMVLYLFAKVTGLAAASAADYWTLRMCDSWNSSVDHEAVNNIQMSKLAEAGVCPWARLAYLFGSCTVILFWTYCAYHARSFYQQISVDPSYKIDFGDEKHDSTARWKFYGVKDPRLDPELEKQPLLPNMQEEEQEYGAATPAQGTTAPGTATRFGPDGFQHSEMIDF